jgi:hypothetical protein
MEDYNRNGQTRTHYQTQPWLCNTVTDCQNYQAAAFLSQKNVFPDAVIFTQLVLPEFYVVISGDGVYCHDMLDSEVEYVKSRIPSGLDVTGHHPLNNIELSKDRKPLW